MSEITSPATPVPAPSPAGFHRPAALIGGGLGLVAVGALATALVLGGPDKNESPYLSATDAAVQAPAAKAGKDSKDVKVAAKTAADTAKKPAAPACAACGVVEAVTPVQHKGEGTGLGAVAGGVLGAVVGHQVGGGDGKKLATVVGAVGGGLAGNEIEKRQRATTVYELKIRMADGTLRSVTQAQALTVGQQVKVEGETVKPA